MKKFFMYMLGIVVLTTAMLSQSAFAANFSDVENHKNQIAIEYLYDSGVINGYSDGTFRPNNDVNRAELLKILIEGKGINTSSYADDTCFSDLASGAWYVQYVCYAKNEGWVQGYGDGTFKPGQTVNRMEALKMLLMSQSLLSTSVVDLNLYDDVDNNAWYYNYLFAAVQFGLTDPSDEIGVIDDMSRGEISEMTYRAMRIYDENLDSFYDADFADVDYLNQAEMMNNDENQYNVGVIMQKPLWGTDLIVINGCDGMCFTPSLVRVSYSQYYGTYTVLTSHSDPQYDSILAAVGITHYKTSDILLHSLLVPQIIKVPNSNAYVALQESDYAINEDNSVINVLPNFSNLYKINQQNVSCLRYGKNDFTIAQYEYDPKFFDADSSAIGEFDDGDRVNITRDYDYTSRGCGVHSNCYYTEESDGLYAYGETNGDIPLTLYLVEDPTETLIKGVSTNAQETLSIYYNSYKSMKEYNNESYLSFDEVVDAKYLIYFKDPMGNFGMIVNDEIRPMAECGKPVVYLYPEEKMDVSVKVLIDELTVTIPEHGENGWNVCAYPDGNIFNYGDGENYSYLFWEGNKDGVLAADKGSLVPRDELESFLNESLDTLGFNATEKADFLEFWLSRMLDNTEDYFFVSFIGTEDFNKVAPLEISPAPDTLIRVFMYFNPTNNYYVPEAQKLMSFERKGFTVFEWGGTSSKEWKK